MVGRSVKRGIKCDAIEHRDLHRAEDRQRRAGVESHILKAINRRGSSTGRTEDKSASGVGGKIAVITGGNSIVARIGIQCQILESREGARTLTGSIDRHRSRAGRRERRGHAGNSAGIGSCYKTAQVRAAIEHDRIIGGAGTAGAGNRSSINGAAIELNFRRARNQPISPHASATVERAAFANKLPQAPLDAAVNRRRMSHGN